MIRGGADGRVDIGSPANAEPALRHHAAVGLGSFKDVNMPL